MNSPEREKAAETGGDSTREPSTVVATDLEDEKSPEDTPSDGTGPKASDGPGQPTTDDEYPHGARLMFIIIALALSIFLMALDTVGLPSDFQPVSIVSEWSELN